MTQAALVCTNSIVLGPMTASGSTYVSSVAVTSPAGCSWTAVSGVAWMTISAGASGTGSGTVRYSIAANTTKTTRSGDLTVAGYTIRVTQGAQSNTQLTQTLVDIAR